jgi:hypothetical protein
MAGIQSRFLDDPTISMAIGNITRCAIASLFYFELGSIPKYINKNYYSKGYILCKLRQSDDDEGNALNSVLNQLSLTSAAFILGDRRLPISISNTLCFDYQGNFRMKVDLAVEAKFSIFLQEGNSTPLNISGSPFSIDNLIGAQGLQAYFGRADHLKRSRSCEDDLVTKRRRLF